MTIFICEACGFEVDYDEDPPELVECYECGELMTAMEDEPTTQDVVCGVIDTVFGLPRPMEDDECQKFQKMLED